MIKKVIRGTAMRLRGGGHVAERYGGRDPLHRIRSRIAECRELGERITEIEPQVTRYRQLVDRSHRGVLNAEETREAQVLKDYVLRELEPWVAVINDEELYSLADLSPNHRPPGGEANKRKEDR